MGRSYPRVLGLTCDVRRIPIRSPRATRLNEGCQGCEHRGRHSLAKNIGNEWAKDADTFNEALYRQSIAQAIVFKNTEKLVSEQPWYQGGGIRSRVVPYAIAKLAHDASIRGRFDDLHAEGLQDGRDLLS